MTLTKTPICDFGKKADFFELKSIENKLINLNDIKGKNGILIIGIDHYRENIPTLNWDEEYNISTNTFSIKEWKDFFLTANLNDVTVLQYGAKEEWQGTLILLGNKKT